MATSVTTTAPEHWRYIAEGGASIVFSYCGPAHPTFTGTALRLRKVPNDSSPDQTAPTGDQIEQDDPSISFQQRVIQRLIPLAHLPHLRSVHVSQEWLEELKRWTEEARPIERRTRDGIDVSRATALLVTDLVGGDALAVEIKPKWGFLPLPTHLSPNTQAVKTSTCRFCMHSHLKSTQGEEVSLGYCPLDLYSGNETRVRKALINLWDVWVGSSGNVNNMRVFVEGHTVVPSLQPSSLAPLALFLPKSETAEEPSLESLRDAFIAVIQPLLMNTAVLHALSTLQRTLDALDIEGLSVLWSLAHQSGAAQAAVGADNVPTPPLGAGFAEPTLADWQTFLDIYLTKHTQMDHAHPDAANVRYYCMAYLLSATFKDCSLIIRIPRDAPGSVTVIDTDVKAASRLSKWAKLDREIVEAYKNVLEPAHCVDQRASL